MKEVEKTVIDMHDILLRIKALESHTEMNFDKQTLYYIVRARKLIERAIKNAEFHLHNDIVYGGWHFDKDWNVVSNSDKEV